MTRVVSIKFRAAGKHYDFNALSFEFAPGDRVVVETDRGRALGTVIGHPREMDPESLRTELKTVLRPAEEADIALEANNVARELEASRFCLQRIQSRQMEMKLVRAEYLFDGSKIIFYFTADGRVDFRELVKDLAHHFHTRIEMRQIGVRDEAKLIGGIGICGRELCCCTFLTDFAPVSVKMAKEQGLALNPSKISGQCGRLLCCLAYEYETYCDLRKALPKCGKRVQVDGQEAEVIQHHLLTQVVKVRFDDGKTAEMTAGEITKGERTKPAQPAPGEQHQEKKERGREEAPGRAKNQRQPQERPQQPRRERKQPQEQPQRAETKPVKAEPEVRLEPKIEAQEPTAEKADQAAKSARRRNRRRRPKKAGNPGTPGNPEN